MYSIDLENNRIDFLSTGSRVYIFNNFKLRISQVLISNSYLIIRGMPRRNYSPPSDYFDDDFCRDNVFLFNVKGELVYKTGRRHDDSGEISYVEYVEYVEVMQNTLKLYYQSNYEIVVDLETGRKLNESYNLKK